MTLLIVAPAAFCEETGPVRGKEHVHGRCAFVTDSYCFFQRERAKIFMVEAMNQYLKELQSDQRVSNLYVHVSVRILDPPASPSLRSLLEGMNYLHKYCLRRTS